MNPDRNLCFLCILRVFGENRNPPPHPSPNVNFAFRLTTGGFLFGSSMVRAPALIYGVNFSCYCLRVCLTRPIHGRFRGFRDFDVSVLVSSESGSIVRCRGRKSAGVVLGGRNPKAFCVFCDPLGANPHRGEHFPGAQILPKNGPRNPDQQPDLVFYFRPNFHRIFICF